MPNPDDFKIVELKNKITRTLINYPSEYEQIIARRELVALADLLVAKGVQNNPGHVEFFSDAIDKFIDMDIYETEKIIADIARDHRLGAGDLEKTIAEKWCGIMDAYTYTNKTFAGLAMKIAAYNALAAPSVSLFGEVAAKKWGAMFNQLLTEDVKMAAEAVDYLEARIRELDRVGPQFVRRSLRQAAGEARAKINGGGPGFAPKLTP